MPAARHPPRTSQRRLSANSALRWNSSIASTQPLHVQRHSCPPINSKSSQTNDGKIIEHTNLLSGQELNDLDEIYIEKSFPAMIMLIWYRDLSDDWLYNIKERCDVSQPFVVILFASSEDRDKADNETRGFCFGGRKRKVDFRSPAEEEVASLASSFAKRQDTDVSDSMQKLTISQFSSEQESVPHQDSDVLMNDASTEFGQETMFG